MSHGIARALFRAGLLAVALGGATTLSANEYSYLRPDAGRGRFSCVPEPGWFGAAFDDRAWLEPPAAPDLGVTCLGTRYHRFTFDAGPEIGRLATLTLSVRYEHGFAAYLNGSEIARRRLEPNADRDALATETHGPEAERIVVPVRPGMLKRAGNLLAFEVHPRTVGHEPVLEVELSAADGPRIIRGPYLLRLKEDEVTVVFDSDLPTTAEVQYGASDAYGQMARDGRVGTHHALRLGGLQAGAAYHYRVTARAPAPRPVAQLDGVALGEELFDAGDARFHTPPEVGRALRFIAYGDVRSGHDVHAQINKAIREEDPDLAIITGDLVDRGSDEADWDKFFSVATPLLREVAVYPAIGNHEYARLGRGAERFYALFRQPLPAGDEDPGYYSFDISGVHFVALDSNQYRSPRQLRWLDQDLKRARQSGTRAIFVYAHEGPYSSGLHGDNALCVHDYVPVLERNHVTMFIGGHDHHFERGRVGTLEYLVTGGGGAELRSPRCGVPGRRACPDRVAAYANEHHYVSIEVMPDFVRLCPKRPDGSALVPCSTLPFRKP
jgi:hypothetical protein